MSSMLEIFANPSNERQLQERKANINEEPYFKQILDEIENGGPSVIMRFKYHLFFKSYFIVLAFPYFHHILLLCKLADSF